MKRLLSILLSVVVVFSLTSCGNSGGDDTPAADTTNYETVSDTTEKNFQSYDELEYKSDIRFTDEELFTFSYKDGEIPVTAGKIVGIFEGGTGFASNLDSSEFETYSDMVTPFGITVGDSLSELCDKFSFDTGFAAYATTEDGIAMYDESQEIPVDKEDGCGVYVGYALDGMGNWAFMDYYMLMMLLQGELVIRGNEGDYNIVVYSFVINGDNEIAQISQLYGEINTVMAYIAPD